jgi:hypothetical protein
MEDLTNMIKPVVHFVGKPRFDKTYYDEVAQVYAEDHPVLGRDKIRTSTVLKKFSDGSFETRNTIYRPVNDS